MSGIPAGWYDDGSGLQRWWDGNAWTEDVLTNNAQGDASRKSGLRGSLQDLGARMTARPDPTMDPNAMWAAVSKPMTGIGGATYKLTAEHLIIEEGVFSSRGRHIRVGDIREVTATQNLSQKFRGVGSITVTVITASGPQYVTLDDVLDFRQGAVLIGKAANDAQSGGPRTNGRDSGSGARADGAPGAKAQGPFATQAGGASGARADGTSNATAASGASPAASSSASPSSSSPTSSSASPSSTSSASPSSSSASSSPTPEDRQSAAMVLNTELLRLAQLHADGVLTDAEFAAAKAKLLGL